jgi:6-phosphofructokinase 1
MAENDESGSRAPKSLAVLTSGGDAQGMNAAVRAVVRTALDRGLDVYAICEGYQGMVDGGDRIRKMTWDSVGGILSLGGTVIGTARCQAFRSREGRLRAAENLIGRGIDRLVVIGGDGSLTGADLFRQEWASLLEELVESGRVQAEAAARHARLSIVGLVGSIDNDMFGTDMTIGADSALHRITAAVDAITSTAASHQRTFVIEVMGRHCGYLALMGAISTGSDWVLIPEIPPPDEDWEESMCRLLKAGRAAGRRDSIVLVAEGARDRHGKAITSEHVRGALEEKLGEDARVTILGHVQRGGSPSVYDRYLSTLLGHAAVLELLDSAPGSEPQLIGMRDNRITRSPLMDCVAKTRQAAELVAGGEFEKALALRSGSFKEGFQSLQILTRVAPQVPPATEKRRRFAVVHSGAPAPGMNAAVRAAVRFGIDAGHDMIGVRNGFRGMIDGELVPMGWMSVAGWVPKGGAELGTNRKVPHGRDFYTIARQLEAHDVHGLLVIGGWSGYEAAHSLYRERDKFPAFNIPIVCLPATINNNLPGSELSVGADTALNNIVEAVDKIKQSAVASRRCFVVEVMGRRCGYLALMGGLATGAERVYLHEEGVTLKDLQAYLAHLILGFERGKRLGLLIRNEKANDSYTTAFMCAMFEEEGGDLFDVRQAILGHLQQGGDPTPFDRILATRLASRCIRFLGEEATSESPKGAFIGVQKGKVSFSDLEDLERLADLENQRPKDQWWLSLGPIARLLAQPGPRDVSGGGASRPA